MNKTKFKINNIPAVLWGNKSSKIFVAVHGNGSNKEDAVIDILAQQAELKGYQLLSFDLPEHGDRKNEETPCKVQYCVYDLSVIMKYVKERWDEVHLFACSMGAYFSLLTYKDEEIKKALFLSPVVDMQRIIENMMKWFNVTPERLKKEQTIETPINQTLYWDYYCYVKEHPINKWDINTFILRGSKDELCESDTIDSFVKKYNCKLEIVNEAEHYFHTKEQLDSFRKWLKKYID